MTRVALIRSSRVDYPWLAASEPVSSVDEVTRALDEIDRLRVEIERLEVRNEAQRVALDRVSALADRFLTPRRRR